MMKNKINSPTCSALLSLPNSSPPPILHATNPPYKLLQADPDPCLATVLSSLGNVSLQLKAWDIAVTSAAYPAAEEASPAAVGKVFMDETWTKEAFRVGEGRVESRRQLARQALKRLLVETSSSKPFSHSLLDLKDGSMERVVTDRKVFWERVTLTLLLMGVFNSRDAFPQYFMQAMFVGADTVTVIGASLIALC